MRRRLAILALVFGVAPLPALPADGEQQAKQAALEFGQALIRSDATLLKPMLPGRGKVKMRLVRLGPEEGSYSAGQVEAVLKDFLRNGSVHSFDLLRVDCAGDSFGLVHARAKVTDREGRRGHIELHITFQPEDDGRWVMREIRETPP